MKRSRLSYDEWKCIISKDIFGRTVNSELINGYIGLIDIILAELFHALQLRPHSLSAIRFYLLIFPGQIADCIIVFLYLLRQAYPVRTKNRRIIRAIKNVGCYALYFCGI